MEKPASTAGPILPQSIAEQPPPPLTVPATISPEWPGETTQTGNGFKDTRTWFAFRVGASPREILPVFIGPGSPIRI